MKATFTDGGSAIAVWPFTVANAPGSALTGPTTPTPVPVVKQSVPAPAAAVDARTPVDRSRARAQPLPRGLTHARR